MNPEKVDGQAYWNSNVIDHDYLQSGCVVKTVTEAVTVDDDKSAKEKHWPFAGWNITDAVVAEAVMEGVTEIPTEALSLPGNNR